MEMFGFSSKWVGFIMRYITTPFLMLINEIAQAFLMLINEIVPGLIQPQRGLRQGYLFVFICIYIMCRGFLKSSHLSWEKKLIKGLRFNEELSITSFLQMIFATTTITWRIYLISILLHELKLLIIRNLLCFSTEIHCQYR